MIVEIDASSGTPPYEQLRTQIATMISSGVLATGARLPPIRQLAADLGLATGTVARAYRELELAGLVDSRVRHGTRVRAAGQPLPEPERRRQVAEGARAFVAGARRLGAGPDDIRAALEAELHGAG